jgi:pimeloyl-ACP methyl ester carboxylesterase
VFSETRYALNGDLRVAYRTSREGPRDIVFIPNWFTNCEIFPELPYIQGWVEAMASLGRLIFFDLPGTGASDPVTSGAMPTLEPPLHRRRLAGRRVVEDDVQVQVGQHCVVDLFQEGQELGGAVTGRAGSRSSCRGHIQGGIQAGGAVADVVVVGPRRRAGQHWEHRRGPVERLNLSLFVHAQHQRPLRRIRMQSDDIADLLHEQRVLGQLPRILFVRRQSECSPHPATPSTATCPGAWPSTASTNEWHPVAWSPELR